MNKKLEITYKNFFLENDLVLSSYFSFAWTTSGIGEFSKIIKIKQKLDTKIFIGINKINEKKIVFGKTKFYNSISKKFEEINLFSVIKREKEIKQFLEKLIAEYNYGFEINILSQIPRGYTLGFSGTLSSLIVSSIYLYFEKINNNIFNENILEKPEIFDEIRKKSFELENLIKNENTAGEASFMSFINSTNPILYHIGENKKNYIGKNILEDNSFPLNYLVVFSGLKVDSDRIEKQIKNNFTKIENIENYLIDNFTFPKKSYLESILKNNSSYHNLNNVLVSLNSFSLYFIKKIIDFENKEDIKDFLENINKIRYSLRIFEEQIDFAEKFYSFFINSKKYENSTIGITSGTSENSGGTFIIFYEDKEKETIINSLKKIKQNYKDLEILFDSNKPLDRNKKYGIKVEQFLSKNILGDFSNTKGVFLETQNHKKIIEYKNLEKLNFDILIDSIKNKIYVNGEKLNSKNIHSQNIASEILLKIIKSKKGEINNTEISFGSYRKNKIELNGKVILPLNKIILEKLKYNFPLKINGKNGHFNIKLDKHQLNIGIINKI